WRPAGGPGMSGRLVVRFGRLMIGAAAVVAWPSLTAKSGEPADAPQAANVGTLRGSITYKGPAVEPRILRGEPDVGPVEDESLVVDPKSSGLANVCIYLQKVPAGVVVPPPPKEPAAVTVKNGRIIPHVVAIRVGQPFTVTNTDPRPYSIRAEG